MKAVGLVAAAGMSSRMGQPKALLPLGGRTFLERAIFALKEGGCDDVIVTLPPNSDRNTIEELARSLGAVTALNAQPTLGLSGSVRTALEHFPQANALVLWPVDAPFGTAKLVAALLKALQTAPAVVPTVDGKRGHPVAFASALFSDLHHAASSNGPRGVLDNCEVYEMVWEDVGIVANINTPADAEAAQRHFLLRNDAGDGDRDSTSGPRSRGD